MLPRTFILLTLILSTLITFELDYKSRESFAFSHLGLASYEKKFPKQAPEVFYEKKCS